MNKKCLVLLTALFLIPTGLALESEAYFVTSEISDEVLEEVEIVGDLIETNRIELKLPLHIKKVNVMFNGDELACNLKEELGYNLLICSIEEYTGSYFLKITYMYEPLDLDGRLFFKTIHEPQADDFILIAKLSDSYEVPEDEITSLVTPQFTDSYIERGGQVFVWKLEDLESFEATIVASPVAGSTNDILLGFFILIGAGIMLFIYVFKKKHVLPKFIEPEQKVVDALKGQKKPIKQKDIQRITGFSKARLSRILKNLEDRDVIKKIPWGRTNLIELKRK